MIRPDSVRNIHNKQIKNGENNKHNTSQIINLLGGIDQVLTDYLSPSSNISINQVQLQTLKQLLQTPYRYQQNNKHVQVTKLHHNPHNDVEDPYTICYYLDSTETYLHSMCGIIIAEKLLQLIHKPITRCIIFTIVITQYILEHAIKYAYTTKKAFQILAIYGIISILFVTPYSVIIMPSINKKGLRFVLQTFEFWFKVINGFFPPFIGIWMHFLEPPEFDEWILVAPFNLAQTIFVVLAIIFIASLDAFYMDNGWKIVFTSTMAIVWTVASLYEQMVLYKDSNIKELHFVQVWFMYFSLEALNLNARRTLAIFFGKQAILSILRRKKDKAVSIKFTPFIKWDTVIQSTGQTHSHDDQNEFNDKDSNGIIPVAQNVDNEVSVLINRQYNQESSSSLSDD